MRTTGKPCEGCGKPLADYASSWAVELYVKLGRDPYRTHTSTVYCCNQECAEGVGTRTLLYALAEDQRDPQVDVYNLGGDLPDNIRPKGTLPRRPG